MAEFRRESIGLFLGAVRKYMEIRGGMTQKDLADHCEVGVSTMSRFLGKKTQEIDPIMVAKIVAVLEIPLYEIIDFVDESYTSKFKRMVKFFQAEAAGTVREGAAAPPSDQTEPTRTTEQDDSLESALSSELGTADKTVRAQIKVGGKTRSMPFIADSENADNLLLKVKSLSSRQKAFLSDFLDLDGEGRDLIVDLGNNLFRYFRQKGMEF